MREAADEAAGVPRGLMRRRDDDAPFLVKERAELLEGRAAVEGRGVDAVGDRGDGLRVHRPHDLDGDEPEPFDLRVRLVDERAEDPDAEFALRFGALALVR